MADISTSTISKPLKAAPDYIFDKKALSTITTNVTSDAFYPTKTQNAVTLVVDVTTAIVLTHASSHTIKIEYLYGASYAKSITLYEKATSGSNVTIPTGELLRWVPSAGMFEGDAKIKVTTNSATGVFSIYPIYISR